MSHEQSTDWPPPPSPREMINWLAFFVGPHLRRREDHVMYLAVQDALVQHFGLNSPCTPD